MKAQPQFGRAGFFCINRIKMTLSEYRIALRDFIKDHDVLNRLIEFREENSSNELDMYIHMALGFLNSTPPMIQSYTISTFPLPSLLIHQASIECLISNGIVMTRNDLAYNNGGINVKISDGTRYLQQLQTLYAVADKEIDVLTKIKIAININAGWGGVASPYASLHGLEGTVIDD
jgi:hypothetical protein